jgi:hypothetical protein
MEAGWVWAYLQSQCDGWKLNPQQLMKHFGVCKDKMYKILTFMISANLLVRHVHTSAKGTHISTTYTVLDGTEYIDPARVIEKSAHQNAPLPEKQDPVLQDPENQDIKKERGLKKKESIKEIINNNSAIEIAHKQNDDAFDEFWRNYPIKKNKVRSKKIWDREKFASIVTLICCDVLVRVKHEPQWQQPQFIPHPATYLGNKLWTDDVTKASEPESSKGDKSSSFYAYMKSKPNGETYDHNGNTSDPFR